jgi:protein N-terminal glutamine amidohydrolase
MAIRYCPLFCEENIWHLAVDKVVPVPVEQRRVVFISNARRRIVIRHQRAGGGGAVFWDYHVVLVADGKVWDPDTTLRFPEDVDLWLRESFDPKDPPRFRVIDAPTYRARFASDRSHMVGTPPPPWPPIGKGMNLMQFVDMETPFLGEVVDAQGLAGFRS